MPENIKITEKFTRRDLDRLIMIRKERYGFFAEQMTYLLNTQNIFITGESVYRRAW